MSTISEDQEAIERLETDGVMFFPPAEQSCRRCGYSHPAQVTDCPRWPALDEAA
jgi:hypothetical protein